MHSQVRAFSQPIRANIYQYQFNNPMLYSFLSSDIEQDSNENS